MHNDAPVSAAQQEMIEAVKTKDLARVQALLDRERSLAHARAETGESAVLLAIYYGAPAVARLLVEYGAEPNGFEAAAMGDLERLRHWLQQEPGLIAAYSPDGWTLLHLTAFFGHAEAADLLLDSGAAIGAISHNSTANHPLHAALAGRRRDVARLLIAHGADVNAIDGSGWSPLHHATQSGDLEMAELLRQHGAT